MLIITLIKLFKTTNTFEDLLDRPVTIVPHSNIERSLATSSPPGDFLFVKAEDAIENINVAVLTKIGLNAYYINVGGKNLCYADRFFPCRKHINDYGKWNIIMLDEKRFVIRPYEKKGLCLAIENQPKRANLVAKLCNVKEPNQLFMFNLTTKKEDLGPRDGFKVKEGKDTFSLGFDFLDHCDDRLCHFDGKHGHKGDKKGKDECETSSSSTDSDSFAGKHHGVKEIKLKLDTQDLAGDESEPSQEVIVPKREIKGLSDLIKLSKGENCISLNDITVSFSPFTNFPPEVLKMNTTCEMEPKKRSILNEGEIQNIKTLSDRLKFKMEVESKKFKDKDMKKEFEKGKMDECSKVGKSNEMVTKLLTKIK